MSCLEIMVKLYSDPPRLRTNSGIRHFRNLGCDVCYCLLLIDHDHEDDRTVNISH